MPIKQENQTVYKCEFCSRRNLTLRGALIHERSYCKSDNSPRRLNCKHEHLETAYSNCGEGVYEPNYDYCSDCGKKFV